jgi:peroxiredoxin
MSFKQPEALGKTIPEFSLKSTSGKMFSSIDHASDKGMIVIFTCNHCPFAKLYSERLNAMSQHYSKLGMPLIAVNSMDTLVYEEELFAEMQRKAENDKFNFPYLSDGDQKVGAQFGAEHTPHAYILKRENNSWKICYSGGIDDNGAEPEKATCFICNAADQLLSGQKISKPITESFGCKIYYRE